MKVPELNSPAGMLKRIKDPAVRMRLAIKQESPGCSDCVHWLPYGDIPWCKKFKHQTASNPLINGIKDRYFCPDFNDQPE
jgi:hypothetical protein